MQLQLLVSLDGLPCEGWPGTGTGCPGRLWALHPRDIQKKFGQRTGQLALGGPDKAVSLDKVAYGDVFQPQSLSTCDCPHALPMAVEIVEKIQNSNYCSE